MRKNCRTCKHPNIELINAELAAPRSTEEVAKKFGIPARTVREHRAHCMTVEQMARLRHEIQPTLDVDIDERVRRGGREAVLGFANDLHKLEIACARCEKMGLERELTANRALMFKIRVEQAKLADRYPGAKRVTNNLVVGDVSVLFDLIDATLRPFPDARQAVALAFANSQQPAALEHAA